MTDPKNAAPTTPADSPDSLTHTTAHAAIELTEAALDKVAGGLDPTLQQKINNTVTDVTVNKSLGADKAAQAQQDLTRA